MWPSLKSSSAWCCNDNGLGQKTCVLNGTFDRHYQGNFHSSYKAFVTLLSFPLPVRSVPSGGSYSKEIYHLAELGPWTRAGLRTLRIKVLLFNLQGSTGIRAILRGLFIPLEFLYCRFYHRRTGQISIRCPLLWGAPDADWFLCAVVIILLLE